MPFDNLMSSPLQLILLKAVSAIIYGKIPIEYDIQEQIIKMGRGHVGIYEQVNQGGMSSFYFIRFVWQDGDKKKACNIREYSQTNFTEVKGDFEGICLDLESKVSFIQSMGEGRYKYDKPSPEIIKLSKEAAARQARMTDENRILAIKQLVKDTVNADD